MNFITTQADDHVTASGATIARVKELVSRLTHIADLATRPIYLDPTPDSKLPNDAIIVATGYPFGFRGKCLRVLFSEWRNKHGYRTVTQTTNQTLTGWNKPKAGTYTMGVAYFSVDTDNHFFINHLALNFYDCEYYARQYLQGDTVKVDRISSFQSKYADLCTARDKKILQTYLKLVDKYKAKMQPLAA